MHHWAEIMDVSHQIQVPMEELRPLHEIVHMLHVGKPSVADTKLVKLIRDTELSLVGFTRQRPFGAG